MVVDAETGIREKVEKTMRILDKIETIDGSPFLYARIKARLDSEPGRSRFRFVSRLISPRTALIIGLVAVNLFTVVSFFSRHSSAVASDESFIVSLTRGYFLSVDDDILGDLEGRK